MNRLPEDTINHHGENTLVLSLWARYWVGDAVGSLSLEVGATVMGGVGTVGAVRAPVWRDECAVNTGRKGMWDG